MGDVCAKHPAAEGLRNAYSGKCVECNREWQAASYQRNLERNREKRRLHAKANAEANSARAREWAKTNVNRHRENGRNWRLKNPERSAEMSAKWVSENLHKCAEREAAKRAITKQATPKWANKFFMQEAYHLARLRTKVFGFQWEVDHIVPLNSELVCGLHTEQNMRVIPAKINAAKGNRHWPDGVAFCALSA